MKFAGRYKRTLLWVAAVLAVLTLTCLLFTCGHLRAIPYSTMVESRSGDVLGARVAADGQWRLPETGEISDRYFTALLEYEDRHFYWHPGINPFSIARAVRQNIAAGKIVSGGSTLTMQLARISRGNEPRSYGRKMAEAFHAVGLELRYSKRRILRLYAAHAPFGGNTVGVEAAAWRYFRHSPAEMSWGEAALLAVLPNSPRLLHLGRNRGELKIKRDGLLYRLHESGRIDRGVYELAVQEPIPERASPMPQMASHLVATLDKTDRGRRVTTTIDVPLQMEIEHLLRRWSGHFAQNNIHNQAALVVDIETGGVLTYCGNVTLKSGFSEYVDVIHARRSTGSLLKPMLYAAMIGEGRLLPSMLLPDTPTYINGFTPKNFNLAYDGAVNADRALARSLNIPFVRMLQDYGVDEFLKLLRRSGLKSLDKGADHYGLSLILGGAESTMWELASMYLRMAQTLTPASEIHALHTHGAPAVLPEEFDLDRGALWQTFEALLEANRPQEIDWKLLPSSRKVAWKTGTSFGFRDGWAVGVTPQHLVIVWVGNATGEGRAGLTGGATAARVMFDIFTLLPASGWFEPPYNRLKEIEICPLSGHEAGANCPQKRTILTAAVPIKVPPCPYHTTIYTSTDGRYRLYRECADGQPMIEATMFVLPPIQERYYRSTSLAYRPMPPLSRRCLAMENAPSMAFIYPDPGARITLPKQMDGSPGAVVAQVAHSNSDAVLYWHLDEDFIGTTTTIHQKYLSPNKGVHLLTVVDDTGFAIHRRFVVE